MVESLHDRYQAKGRTLFGAEKLEWTKLKDHFNLQDLGAEGVFYMAKLFLR